jgi:putative transposase
MARIARAVAPGIPHHIIQRGNRRQKTFFNNADYQTDLSLMSHWCHHLNVEIWTYCSMPNHVHLIAVQQDKQGLNLAIAETHKRYSRQINFREGWRGHLRQDALLLFMMDASYLIACAKYILLNPVRAKIVKAPED